MKTGVIFPQTEFGNDPGAIKAYAQTVEGLGFWHILAYDHVLSADTTNPAIETMELAHAGMQLG